MNSQKPYMFSEEMPMIKMSIVVSSKVPMVVDPLIVEFQQDKNMHYVSRC